MEILGEESKMGIKELMIMVLFICCSASTTLGKNSSDNYRGGRGLAHPAKFGGLASGGRGESRGQPGATSGDTNGDGSHSPYTQGGSSIPIFAAGAGAANNHNNNHRRHHSDGDSKHSTIRSAALAATILECLLLYI